MDPDYDNRVDCLQTKLWMVEINSIRNRRTPQIAREQKIRARSLIERNARRRKMNDNVISIRGSNEKYDRSVEYATCFAKIGNSKRNELMLQLSIVH